MATLVETEFLVPRIREATATAASSAIARGSRSDHGPSGEGPLSFLDGTDGRVHSDGVFYRIMEYLEPRDFYVLGALAGNRFWKDFLFENPHTNYLFCRNQKTNGRDILKNTYWLQQSIRLSCKLHKKRKSRKTRESQAGPLHRLNVFESFEEDQIAENNLEGYFGMAFLRPNVMGIWGNFSGFFLTSRVGRFFSSRSKSQQGKLPPSSTTSPSQSASPVPENETNERELEPINATMKTEEGYLFGDSNQVMAVHFGSPYVFLGFASGKIHAIDSNPVPVSSAECQGNDTEASIEYPHVSECLYHCPIGEISSLTPVDGRHLVSSCVRSRDPRRWPNDWKVGELLIHWNALIDGNLQRISMINLSKMDFPTSRRPLSSHHGYAPLAMASSSIRGLLLGRQSDPVTVVSIGSSCCTLGHFILWRTNDEINAAAANEAETGNTYDIDNPPPAIPKQRWVPKIESSDEDLFRQGGQSRGGPYQSFVFLKYFQGNQLVVGTSRGHLLRKEMKLHLETHCIWNCCRKGPNGEQGALEAVELVPTRFHKIMITAGGYDGTIRFWDWETLSSLGDLSIHPGFRPDAERLFYSPVISTFFCHHRSSLISLCRDGHVHEWNVEDVYRKHRRKIQQQQQQKQTNRHNEAQASSSKNGNLHTHQTRSRKRRVEP